MEEEEEVFMEEEDRIFMEEEEEVFMEEDNIRERGCGKDIIKNNKERR